MSDAVTIEGAQFFEHNNFVVILAANRYIYEVFKHQEQLLLVELDLIPINKVSPKLCQLVF